MSLHFSEPVELIWGNVDLIIKNAPKSILKPLYYMHKSLEMNQDTWTNEIAKEKVELYRELAPNIVTTFQGFKDLVINTCAVEGIPYKIADARLPFPGPKVNLAGDFRFGQKMLFLQTIGRNRSGICKAPTRYGKMILLANVIRVFPGLKTVVTAPELNLLHQLERDLKRWCPGRQIHGVYTGSRQKQQGDDVTVLSMDSLHKADHDGTRLVLIDEPHAIAAPSRYPELMKFRNARFLGFGATTEGRFDGADQLITGLIGPVIARKTFTEAVEEGAICPIVIYIMRLVFTPWSVFKRDAAYRQLVLKNQHFQNLLTQILNQVIPQDWQAITFIKQVEQGQQLQEKVPGSTLAVAKLMDKTTRQETYNEMVEDKIKRCFATDIYSTGLTFPDLRVVVNAAGGGGAIMSTQKPGRLAQVRPNKTVGYVIDFLFEPVGECPGGKAHEFVTRDCFARMDKYRKSGFEVRMVDDLAQIHLT